MDNSALVGPNPGSIPTSCKVTAALSAGAVTVGTIALAVIFTASLGALALPIAVGAAVVLGVGIGVAALTVYLFYKHFNPEKAVPPPPAKAPAPVVVAAQPAPAPVNKQAVAREYVTANAQEMIKFLRDKGYLSNEEQVEKTDSPRNGKKIKADTPAEAKKMETADKKEKMPSVLEVVSSDQDEVSTSESEKRTGNVGSSSTKKGVSDEEFNKYLDDYVPGLLQVEDNLKNWQNLSLQVKTVDGQKTFEFRRNNLITLCDSLKRAKRELRQFNQTPKTTPSISTSTTLLPPPSGGVPPPPPGGVPPPPPPGGNAVVGEITLRELSKFDFRTPPKVEKAEVMVSVCERKIAKLRTEIIAVLVPGKENEDSKYFSTLSSAQLIQVAKKWHNETALDNVVKLIKTHEPKASFPGVVKATALTKAEREIKPMIVAWNTAIYDFQACRTSLIEKGEKIAAGIEDRDDEVWSQKVEEYEKKFAKAKAGAEALIKTMGSTCTKAITSDIDFNPLLKNVRNFKFEQKHLETAQGIMVASTEGAPKPNNGKQPKKKV